MQISISIIPIATLLLGVSAAETLSPALEVVRCGTVPIIDAASFSAIGASGSNNINGPSCVRIPSWVAPADRADPTAIYYLYFANHADDEIRMAWAVNIKGPWTLFNMGTNDDPRVAGDGVLDLGPTDAIGFTGGASVFGHIASPDVEIDEVNQQFVMFFHGPANGTSPDAGDFDTNTQKTLVATSSTGLNFNLPTGVGTGGVGGGETGHGVRNAILGNAYFRTFRYDGELYAFSNNGPIWKAPNAAVPWQTSDPRADAWDQQAQNVNPIFDDLSANYTANPGVAPRYNAGNPTTNTGAPRHFATLLQDDNQTLEVWYTCKGEQPERIFRTTMDLSQGSWAADTWTTVVSDPSTIHDLMLLPELNWEGANRPLAISLNGSQVNVNQLRDPDLFRDDDGKVYLFYSGEGEEAIGLAEVLTTEANDTTAPTIASSDIVDDKAGATVESNLTVTYTVTFSEDIDESTVDASDFDNANPSTPIIIGSITEPSPGEFRVEVTPTTTGTLRLRIPTTASIADPSGNLLDNDPAILDDTTLDVVEGLNGTISKWNIARDSPAGSVNTDLNTSSPTFGDGSTDNVNEAFVTGEFGETVSLAVGETLRVSLGITFTGGSSINPNQYRFVVGDYGTTADQSWVGGWNFVPDQNLYQARTNGNVQSTNPNAQSLVATAVTSGTFNADSTAAYAYTFSITRDSATTVDLSGRLVGGDGTFDLTYTKENQATSLFDYNGMGILFGGFSELDQATVSNAQYSVLPSAGPSDYVTWNTVEYPGADLSDPNGDFDKDGFSNDSERLFALDPTSGSSVSPISIPLDPNSGTLTYTRRNPGLTGATYSYQYSTTLGSWQDFTPASEIATDASPVESVTITVPAEQLSNPELFIRVSATEAD
ncbi:hypothetical protein [Haloferula sp.]|uniref:Ig-like domain-containing protein n=1 Tax=Haloferula sp. TaxID=2497595 RepID=UPI003C783A2F